MKVVIGVDSGGSHTRALAVTLDGERVGYAETGGGNPSHDAESKANVRQAIEFAAKDCGIENVVRVVAGIAGYEPSHGEEVIAEATAAEGLRAPRQHVNDADIAHFGAFSGGPGIVSIQGTGSMILAILEGGRRVQNTDFMHYASAGAVRLGMRTVVAVLTGDMPPDDREMLFKLLRLWGVDSLPALREAMTHLKDLTSKERTYRFGQVARLCTRSAEGGFRFAEDLCRAAALEIVEGIRLLGPMFGEDEVPVTLIGACVRSAPMRWEVESLLAVAKEKEYQVVEPAHPPVVGAVLLALRAEGIDLDDWLLRRDGTSGPFDSVA